MSQLRCIRLATPRFRRTVNTTLNRMDHLTKLGIVQAIEIEIRDKKGRQIWLLFNMVPMLDANGEVERYFGTYRDITDMVETEQRLAVETKKAQETELLKQAFLTNMSYEIRTPLNTVLGFAQMFNMEHDAADEPLFAEEIKTNANALLSLVNESLYLSRLDAHMIERHPSDNDFPVLFDSYCRIGMGQLKPGVMPVIESPYEHMLVTMDEEWIGQVIQRLCNNAAHNTTEGFVRAKYEYRQGVLTISIDDSGQGVDAQTLPHIFDRFVTDSQGNHFGSGLDLPIVKELVEQMGGSVECQSERGKGTSIWVSIPCEATSIEKKKDMLPTM
jgi:signal transduction histidine kinase